MKKNICHGYTDKSRCIRGNSFNAASFGGGIIFFVLSLILLAISLIFFRIPSQKVVISRNGAATQRGIHYYLGCVFASLRENVLQTAK